VTRQLFGVAAACVVAAGGIYRWGLSRHLDIIAERRSALRSRLSAAVAARETLDQVTRSVNAIQSLERRSPRWSATVARIAVALPRDASLIALRADGDSVSLEGLAGNAAAVFAALRSVPGVVDVRSTAPIRQEFTVGQNSIEHWTLAFRVDRK
jgi:Tfp pilus assembly protein PilN